MEEIVWSCLDPKMQKFYKSLAWCIKYSQKINRITKIDCKSRDEFNKLNQDVIRH